MDLTPNWEYVADTVMGGVSRGRITPATIDGRAAMRLTGKVSLDNNGGFIQMAFDLNGGAPIDASDWSGIELDTYGNNEPYELRLRTTDLRRPWQSYRAEFTAAPRWETHRLPFSAFTPHRIDIPFNPAKLRRIGVLAIGRAFDAEIAVAGLRFLR